MEPEDAVLWVIARKDLYMTPGLAAAQVAHAASALAEIAHDLESEEYTYWLYFNQWLDDRRRQFGTTIVLGGDYTTCIQDLVPLQGSSEILLGSVVDPTYPFFVPDYIGQFVMFDAMENQKFVAHVPGGERHTRQELTCTWVFGSRTNKIITNALGGFNLY